MRKTVATAGLVALIATSCGMPPESSGLTASQEAAGLVPPDTPVETMCRAFVEATAPLFDPDIGFEQAQRVLAEAAEPLVLDVVIEQGLVPVENQPLLSALEHIYAGAAAPDHLWAIDDVAALLVAEGHHDCSLLSRHLGGMPMPPPTPWQTPPAVEVNSDYSPGTADEACDVFILTVNPWMADASHGAEYGPSLADATDELIGRLDTLGLRSGIDELVEVSERFRTQQWAQAGEEGGKLLMEAAEKLSGSAPRCGDLFDALIAPAPEMPEPDYSDRHLVVTAVPGFEPVIACGPARVSGGEPIPTLEPLDEDARQAVAALEAVGLEGSQFTDHYIYRIFERTGDQLILIGEAPDGSSRSYAKFQWIDGAWNAAGWGGCDWTPADYGPVRWQPHPNHPLDQRATTIELLVEDRCGVVYERGHDVIAAAAYADGTVSLEVWEAYNPPPESGREMYEAGCLIGATMHLSVRLREPIGDRTLTGASAAPWGRNDDD